jgi:phospholipid N-methyltransferase
MPIKSLISIAQFSGEFLSNPESIGSVIPSSRALGRRMAGFVPAAPEGYVVELGAGTGPITAALLQRGVPPEQLVSIDCCPTMVRVLKKRYPTVNVLAGNAARLQSLLADHIDLKSRRVTHIVSSLPLKSLPKTEVAGILSEIKSVLRHGGRFIQFTYDLRRRVHPVFDTPQPLNSSIVWMNFPPARVSAYDIHPQATT